MLKTYKARLRDNRVEWLEKPPEGLTTRDTVEVYVTLPDDRQAERKSGAKMVAALEKLAALGTLEKTIPDPVAWQREIREDRPLPERD